MFSTCKHKWLVLSEKETESQLEHFKNNTGGHFPEPRNSVQMKELCKRKFIQVMTCTECGKLKRFVEQI